MTWRLCTGDMVAHVSREAVVIVLVVWCTIAGHADIEFKLSRRGCYNLGAWLERIIKIAIKNTGGCVEVVGSGGGVGTYHQNCH